MMNQIEVIDDILAIFKTMSRTELLLNTLMYTDFGRWEQRQIRIFIKHISSIVSSGHEQNRILLCYNPIMAISLACEFLVKISRKINIFRHEGMIIKNNLVILGHKLVEQLEDDKIDKVFLDLDFKDRSTLKIITDNKFAEILKSDKINVLLEEIWQGKLTFECDGNVQDFSCLTFLVKAPTTKLPGKKVTI